MPANPVSDVDFFDDPLLQAMASTSQARDRQRLRPATPSDPTPIAPWVRRLDADINVLSDLASRPMPPLSRKEPEPGGTDDSLSA